MNRSEQNWIRTGFVSSIDVEKGYTRVAFDDRAGLVSFPCQNLIPFSGKNNASFPYDIGEQVLCLFLPNGQQTGFILGTMSSEVAKAPSDAAEGVYIVVFEDGTVLKYDRNTHQLVVNVNGDLIANVSNKAIVSASGGVEINGNVTVNGYITATGDMTVDGVSLRTHIHSGVQSGGSNTGGPQ